MSRGRRGFEIICDTDFIMKLVNDPLPKLDWRSMSRENDFVTLPCVVRELNGLTSSQDRKTSIRARNSLTALKSGILGVIPPESESEEVDFALLDCVRRKPNSRLLATLDGSLLSMLEKNGLGYLTLTSNRPVMKPRKQQRI